MKEVKSGIAPSVFKNLSGIEYFEFEEDFVEQNIRCIPMIVRFKMDAAGIKLKLAEWAKFDKQERIGLAVKNCSTHLEIEEYKNYLLETITRRTGHSGTIMSVNENPEWAKATTVPEKVLEKMKDFGASISIEKWSSLTNLQRFALLKLVRPGHENKNFPIAMKEFKLM